MYHSEVQDWLISIGLQNLYQYLYYSIREINKAVLAVPNFDLILLLGINVTKVILDTNITIVIMNE